MGASLSILPWLILAAFLSAAIQDWRHRSVSQPLGIVLMLLLAVAVYDALTPRIMGTGVHSVELAGWVFMTLLLTVASACRWRGTTLLAPFDAALLGLMCLAVPLWKWPIMLLTIGFAALATHMIWGLKRKAPFVPSLALGWLVTKILPWTWLYPIPW